MSVQFLPPRPKSFSIANCRFPIGFLLWIPIGNRKSKIGNVLRDGVTGNASGFELEDEGSTPSPAANLFKLATRISIDSTNKKQAVDLEVMFIRFVGAEIDERSHV